MHLSESNPFIHFKDIEINKYINLFVPYLILDGHRSSNPGTSDVEKYESGVRFFIRFGEIFQKLGFNKMVTIVHSARNCNDVERIESIQSAIKRGLNFSNEFVQGSKFLLYGDMGAYKSVGKGNFNNYLSEVIMKAPEKPSFTNHILINYSEDWAINNQTAVNNIPEISCVIRFTKGFISGSWIPFKMQKTVFVYSQVPSVSEFWLDNGILSLILISLKSWLSNKDFIGTKLYEGEEKELLHEKRDIDLSLKKINLDLNSPLHNRIISFDVEGPVIYEL